MYMHMHVFVHEIDEVFVSLHTKGHKGRRGLVCVFMSLCVPSTASAHTLMS